MAKLSNLDITGIQHGHRQAMTKTFLRLKTRPEEYTPVVQKCFYNEVTHCELCGAALIYSFHLVHCDDPDGSQNLSLKVGADCIFNFCKIYMPSSADQILYTIEQALADSKVNKFKNENPHIFEVQTVIKNKIAELTRQYGYQFKQLNEFVNFNVYSRELTRNQYLSKPRVQYLEKLEKIISSVKFEKMLQQHQKHTGQPLTEYLKKYPQQKKIYRNLQELGSIVNYYGNNLTTSLSDLDLKIYRQKINAYLQKLKPGLWLEQFNQEPDLVKYLLSGTFERYSSEIAAQNTFKRFIPLNSYTIKTIKESNDFNKNKRKLPKIPTLWYNIYKLLKNGKGYEV